MKQCLYFWEAQGSDATRRALKCAARAQGEQAHPVVNPKVVIMSAALIGVVSGARNGALERWAE